MLQSLNIKRTDLLKVTLLCKFVAQRTFHKIVFLKNNAKNTKLNSVKIILHEKNKNDV